MPANTYNAAATNNESPAIARMRKIEADITTLRDELYTIHRNGQGIKIGELLEDIAACEDGSKTRNLVSALLAYEQDTYGRQALSHVVIYEMREAMQKAPYSGYVKPKIRTSMGRPPKKAASADDHE